ncbi:MAG: MFS transporter [Candidatus Omnitrophota bacterium]
MKRKLIFWDIWSSYAIYYFGKVNISIVVPALLVSYKDLNLYSVGLVSSGFFFVYALGQFLHGQISERCNPFKYIAVGLIGSAIVNLLLGFSAGYFVILFLGASLEGFFQSMGWSSCVRANSLIQKATKREKYSTILGTSYQVGNSVAWLATAFAVGQWGWRAGFWLASIVLLIKGVLLLLTMPKLEIPPHKKIKTQIKNTLSFPIVLSGLSLCLLNMVRFGIITWIPLYLFKSQNLTVAQMGKVGLNIFLIPIAGVLGTLLYNMSKVNRDVQTIISLVLLAVSLAAFPFTTGLLATVLLLASGFFLYGPHVFLVTTFPTRFVGKQVVAASTGFIDGMGYIGTVLIGVIVPFLVGLGSGNWNIVFFFWACISILVAILVAVVYVKSFKDKTIDFLEVK